jgi:signal transduction histidine kinase
MGSLGYIKSSMNGYGWIGVGLSTIFFVIAGTISLIYYTRLNYLEDQQDIILERKFDAASTGISVFVHSIKNQLLASRVLNKKLMQELAKEQPCLNEVNAYAIKLNEMNESTLDHLNELYKSAKSSTLSMRPEPVSLIAEKSEMLFSQKYPDSSVIFELENPRQMVLADITHLSEAIYNLLINGYEAAVQAGREAPGVKLIIHNERLWTVFEIKDNGIGIPRSKQLKIFEPFYTSKNTNYNWGMGLYYVRKIVKSHLGKLRIESAENKGTNIFILLPKLSSGI